MVLKISIPLKKELFISCRNALTLKYELKTNNVILFHYAAHQSQDVYETFANNCELNLDSVMTINPV